MTAFQNRNEDASQYEFIIKKLQKTVEAYKGAFPDLNIIQAELEQTASLTNPDKTCAQKLQAICEVLKEHTVQSYIIRHLYHNFCRDVAVYLEGTHLYDEAPFYIETPNA